VIQDVLRRETRTITISNSAVGREGVYESVSDEVIEVRVVFALNVAGDRECSSSSSLPISRAFFCLILIYISLSDLAAIMPSSLVPFPQSFPCVFISACTQIRRY
jgi:hypothetical protein